MGFILRSDKEEKHYLACVIEFLNAMLIRCFLKELYQSSAIIIRKSIAFIK
jgi:hypothetical protein